MTPVAMLSVPLYRSRAAAGDKVFGVAEAKVGGRPATVEVTTRGMYLGLISPDGAGAGFGVDLNALARAMADAAEAYINASEEKP